MINIAICDDVAEDAEAVENGIRAYLLERNIPWECKIYQSSRALWYELEDGQCFDLLFLDIEMQELNGFALAEKIKKRFPELLILFVTVHESLVYRSFEFQPFRFIPKQKMDIMLIPALKAAVEEITAREQGVYIAENQQGIEKIPFKNMVYLWKDGKYVYIEKWDGTQCKVRKALKQIAKELPEEEFVWADRGYLCNLSHIVQIRENQLRLSTGAQLYIGERKQAALKKQIMTYWGRGKTNEE